MRSRKGIFMVVVGALLVAPACQIFLVVDRDDDSSAGSDAAADTQAQLVDAGARLDVQSDLDAATLDAAVDSVADASVDGCSATAIPNGTVFCEDFSGPTFSRWAQRVAPASNGAIDLVSSGHNGTQAMKASVLRPPANPCSFARLVQDMPPARHVLTDYWVNIEGPDSLGDEYVVAQSVIGGSETCVLLTGFQYDGVSNYKVHLVERQIAANGVVTDTPYSTGGAFGVGVWVRITTDFDLSDQHYAVAVGGVDAGSGPLTLSCATAQASSVSFGPDCVGPGSGPVSVSVKFDDIRIERE